MIPVQFQSGQLPVEIYPTEAEAARAAAERASAVLRTAVERHGTARVILATGNSQLAFARALCEQPVPWEAVTIFHMDEYVGIDADHPASFRRWIRTNLVERVGATRVEYLNGDAPSVETECRRYESRLREAPIDLTCMGIGENGHLAFNEPGQANLTDLRWVRVVALTRESILQQVREGHFLDADAVPGTAISVTVPGLVSAAAIQVVVPESRKAPAVRAALTGEISADVPASVLRQQPHARLFLDHASASLLDHRHHMEPSAD